MLTEVNDARLVGLISMLESREGGAFCNNAVMVDEVRSMVAELMMYRERPTHCVGCDGDHL